jgi:ferric iron reductase protein FhuF
MEMVASLSQIQTISLHQLFFPTVMQSLLTGFLHSLKAPSQVVIASQFSKRYSSSLLLPSLKQLLTTGNVAKLDLESDLLVANSAIGDFHLQIAAHQNNYQIASCNKEQIDLFIQHYFANHLVPLWELLAKLTGIKTAVLWENTYVYIAWACLQQVGTPQAKEHFLYLTKEAPGSLFGLDANPFVVFSAVRQVERRRHCCLYKLLPSANGEKCSNCPLHCR